jgi:hypothetical protein
MIISCGHPPVKISTHVKQGSPPHWKIFKVHTAFNLLHVYDYTTKLFRKGAEVTKNHENIRVRSIGQGEARHRKYEGLKLGGG